MDEHVSVKALFTPKFFVKFGRKRSFDWNEIDKNKNDQHEWKVAFDDFYCLLGACLFEDALLVSSDNFGNILPFNLKRGNLPRGYSVIMSPAKASKEDAKVIDGLR